MPEGLEGVKLTIYNEDGTVNDTQYVMVNSVTEESTTVMKLSFEIVNASTHETIAEKRIGFHALKQAVEAFE